MTTGGIFQTTLKDEVVHGAVVQREEKSKQKGLVGMLPWIDAWSDEPWLAQVGLRCTMSSEQWSESSLHQDI
jgi:hypothetical protein